MFSESSLLVVHDVRTNRKQEAHMARRTESADTHLAEDLAGMAALIVLLVVGLHLRLLA